MTDWIDFAYTAVALVVAALLIYVMQKTEHDRINKMDSVRVQWLRRLTFICAALALLYSISATNWQLACLILVGASGAILAVNAVALNMRSPPVHGIRIRASSVRTTPHVMGRIVNYFSSIKKDIGA